MIMSSMPLSVFTFLTQHYLRLCEALVGLLMPGLNRLRKLSFASLCRLEAGKLRLCETLFGLLVSIASAPVAYSGHESSRWLLHVVYLIYANWGLNFLYGGSHEIEIIRSRAIGFYYYYNYFIQSQTRLYCSRINISSLIQRPQTIQKKT